MGSSLQEALFSGEELALPEGIILYAVKGSIIIWLNYTDIPWKISWTIYSNILVILENLKPMFIEKLHLLDEENGFFF